MRIKSTKALNKILIVSYHFPPAREVGGIRPAKFAKYLPEFGWRPYVLTIKERYLDSPDYGRLQDVRGLSIYRASVLPTLAENAVRLRNRFIKRQESHNRRRDAFRTPTSTIAKSPGGFLKKLMVGLRHLAIFLSEYPDPHSGWFLPAVVKGLWVIKKEGIPIILATSPPYTAAIVGLILAKLTGARLITDLRDPWILNRENSEGARSSLAISIHDWVGRRVIDNSLKVIATTDHYTSFLRKRHSYLPQETFCTIANGFDSSDFAAVCRTERKRDVFVISYLGTFYFGRTPKELLQAVGELIREGHIAKDTIRVNLVGDVRYAEGVKVEDLIHINGLSDCVALSDSIIYKESLVQMQGADILLVFAPKQYYSIPAKVFEYFGARKYMLCVGHNGATADLIRNTGTGIVVDEDNVEAIKAALKYLYDLWILEGGLDYKYDLSRFERRELSGRLAAVLKEGVET